MIKKIKDKLLFIIPILLILYFVLNLLGGNRGLFSYFEKRNHLNNLKNEEKLIQIDVLDHRHIENKFVDFSLMI